MVFNRQKTLDLLQEKEQRLAERSADGSADHRKSGLG